jgi:hypothetical protein
MSNSDFESKKTVKQQITITNMFITNLIDY